MKNTDKMNFEKLLSWDEVFRLGEPTDLHTLLFSTSFFKRIIDIYYSEADFDYDFNKFITEPLVDKIPKLATVIPNLNIRFRYDKDEFGEYSLIISPEYFFLNLILGCMDDLDQMDEFKNASIDIANEPKDKAKEHTLQYLDTARKILDKKRYSSDSSSLLIDNGSYQLSVFEAYKIINYAYKNYDYIYDVLTKNIDYSFLKTVSKDAFITELCYYIFYHCEKLLQGGCQEAEVNSLVYLHNYCLLVDYLSEVNGEQYEFVFKKKNDGLRLKSEYIYDFAKDFDEYNINNPDYQEFVNKYKTYEDLLKDRAKKAWDKIKEDKFYKTIECNWEVIPEAESGLGVSEAIRPGRINTSVSSREKIEATMKKAYDILDEKVDTFYQVECEQLVGKNSFLGYVGFLYPNGLVIFEKFYKVSKKDPEKKVPAINEAIYVMNRDNFAEMSRLSKPEIISYINDFGNKDVMRIYHRGAWKERVSRIINSSDYDVNDLVMIDKLTKDLSKNKKKEKIKDYDE